MLPSAKRDGSIRLAGFNQIGMPLTSSIRIRLSKKWDGSSREKDRRSGQVWDARAEKSAIAPQSRRRALSRSRR
jgi:hypothetical protein